MNDNSNNLSSRCVVLVPLERIDAARHVAQKFELSATFEHHPSLAMAEVCLLHQQITSKQSWNATPTSPHLVLIYAEEMYEMQKMIDAIRKYLPRVIISELRDGQIERIDNNNAVLDELIEPPIIHSEAVDADELSMLLDTTPQEVDEQ